LFPGQEDTVDFSHKREMQSYRMASLSKRQGDTEALAKSWTAKSFFYGFSLARVSESGFALAVADDRPVNQIG
jgi:hypothetical protein